MNGFMSFIGLNRLNLMETDRTHLLRRAIQRSTLFIKITNESTCSPFSLERAAGDGDLSAFIHGSASYWRQRHKTAD